MQHIMLLGSEANALYAAYTEVDVWPEKTLPERSRNQEAWPGIIYNMWLGTDVFRGFVDFVEFPVYDF